MAKVIVKLQNRTIREVHIGGEPMRRRDPFNEIHLENPDGKPKDIAHFEGTILVNPDKAKRP